jgi:hypothetical protein
MTGLVFTAFRAYIGGVRLNDIHSNDVANDVE